MDQPAMARAKLSDAQRTFVQKRVETMHKMVKRESRWIKSRGASAVGLAVVDSALLVTPPSGMEFGYVPVVLYEGLDKPKECNEPAPTPPTPPAPPTPPSPPAPPGTNTVTLFELEGSGKLTIPAAEFTPNSRSSRGGALAWDACAGGVFDNGNPVWTGARGTNIGGFKVNGDWKLRASTSCGKSFDYPGMSLSREYSAADAKTSFTGLVYFEHESQAVEFV